MNRIIKFRAWDYNHKKYRYPKLWDNTMPSNWNEWFMLEQFTGMTDKNGTEIYEGDIIEIRNVHKDWEEKMELLYLRTGRFKLNTKVRPHFLDGYALL